MRRIFLVGLAVLGAGVAMGTPKPAECQGGHCPPLDCLHRCSRECACVKYPGELTGVCVSFNAIPDEAEVLP